MPLAGTTLMGGDAAKVVPDEMTVVEAREPGGPEVLVTARHPIPVPAAGEVLVAVAAAGVNGPDLVQRRGHYPPPPGASDLLGLEVSGDRRRPRRGRRRLVGRRPRHRPDQRRRLRRILHGRRTPLPSDPRARHARGCGRPARDLLHRLVEHLLPGPPAARQAAPRPRRRRRHRLDGDPARQGLRRHRPRDREPRRPLRLLPRRSAPTG